MRGKFSRLGFTLVEVLVVMLIMGILASSFTIVYRRYAQGRATEREAQRLSRWLTNLATLSNRTGRSFRLVCPGSFTRGYIEVIWLNPLERVTYTSVYGCVFRRLGGQNVDSLYSPQWSAMVPTITIEVSRGRERHYVIVSQSGRVRTSSRPPP